MQLFCFSMTWLYNLSSALYPSLYLTSGSLSDEDRAEITRARTSEALRVAGLDGRTLPVYPYISISYHDNGNLISKVSITLIFCRYQDEFDS